MFRPARAVSPPGGPGTPERDGPRMSSAENQESRPPTGSPWHRGELAVQARVGALARMDEVGRHVVRTFMPDQHRTFFAQLPFLVVGSVDAQGFPWASLVCGPPGFATSPDPHTLRIAAHPLAADPLAAALRLDASLGVLGIELPTRRRNRLNGHVTSLDATGFTVVVEQSFGNCAQYVQRRSYASPPASLPQAVCAEPFSGLPGAAQDLVESCDTCFVASYARAETSGRPGVDVSHRGGRPGFLGVADDGAIVVPDYAGNSFFNTLGNLLVNPLAALLVIDFATGDLLQLVGTTEIVWDGPVVRAFTGAQRLWRIKPLHGRWLRRALPIALSFEEISPKSLLTGTWEAALSALAGELAAGSRAYASPAP